MRTTRLMFTVLALAAVAFGGCRKAQSCEVQGTKVDAPQRDVAFANAGPAAQASTAMFKRFFRYGQDPQAFAELDKLARQPSLTGP